jgi:UDP-2-acetamido-2,6-beta-L-arabino-hexul-4-ose reductase
MFDISNNKKLSFRLSDKKLKVVESIPGYQHYIKNIGNKDLIVLLWCNEIFDVKKPDTFKI